MCGIAGSWSPRHPLSNEQLVRMANAIKYRGPDDIGTWQESACGLGLAHRRLSILDLSPAGHQPMHSAGGRYVIVFNGEIYNFAAMRRDLDAESGPLAWRGHSDTEILLAGFERWGIHQTLRRANGMFAIAVFDREQRSLHLARDRMGEKPLYFGWVQGEFCFASELKALATLDGWQPRIDPQVAAGFLRQGYVGGPRSLVQGLFRLPPGTHLELGEDDIAVPRAWPDLEPSLDRYWSLAETALAGRRSAAPDPAEAIERFDALLRESIALRMVADVPVGAFLSGGIDSSAVVAVMQQVSARPVRTFSIGFRGGAFDEAPFAAAVARHLGTDHTELYVTPQDALAVIPQLPTLYDEPFADDSQIPTVLLTRLARPQVTVALSGDGGDELFAGYKRYTRILKFWKSAQKIPPALRPALASLIQGTASLLHPFAAAGDDTSAAFRLSRVSGRLRAHSIDELRRIFRADTAILGAEDPQALLANLEHCRPPNALEGVLDRILFADQSDYLPDDILVKVDRAAMACSLETRIPLLDPAIVAFAWSLPIAQLRAGGRAKLPLRGILDRYVPRELIDRPKRGFGLPLADWLRDPLRPWAESLLEVACQQDSGLWDAGRVRLTWKAHLSGRADHHAALWNLLTLVAWQQHTGAAT